MLSVKQHVDQFSEIHFLNHPIKHLNTTIIMDNPIMLPMRPVEQFIQSHCVTVTLVSVPINILFARDMYRHLKEKKQEWKIIDYLLFIDTFVDILSGCLCIILMKVVYLFFFIIYFNLEFLWRLSTIGCFIAFWIHA